MDSVSRDFGSTPRRSRRLSISGWLPATKLTAGMLLVAAVAITLVVAVFAVHDTADFELEGDIADDGSVAGPDWGSIFDAGGGVADLHGGIAAGFLMDDISPAGLVDHTVFTSGGTKNDQQPSVDWNWGTQSVPEKDDLSNVYSFGTLNASGHLVLYAGLERLAPNGDSHLDGEFNANLISLDEAPPCDNEPCHFLGNKTVGDVLVAMDYTKGGANAGALDTVRVFQWDGSQYAFVSGITGADCNGADTICGFSNEGPADDGGPWTNYNSHGDVVTTLPKNAF